MATKKNVKSKKPAAKAPSKSKAGKARPAAVKPIKEVFSKSDLVRYLAAQTQVEFKRARDILEALESAMLGSVNKSGARQFTMPGLFKVTVQPIAAKEKRFGKDPFTGVDRWFDAKPATVRVKVRALKKLKAAAL